MTQLATLVKDVKRFAADPAISDEEFLNAFISAYVIAGNIRNKKGDELHLDKAATSLLLNQKADVHQQLRKALRQYGIREATEKGMPDFVEDYLCQGTLSALKRRLRELASENDTMYSDDVPTLLADLLVASLSEDNRADPKRNILWKNGANIVEVITGDIFRYGPGNRRKGQKNIVVIPVNTAYDTHVTWNLEGDTRPIVSINTLHGKWLMRMEQSGIDISDLDARITASLKALGYEPIACDAKRNGKADMYAIGSCALIETLNADYILVAVSIFDEMNKAQSNPEIIETAVQSLLQTYDKIGQGYDMYIPLIGTGRSRAGLSIVGAYELLKNSIVKNADLIQGHIYLVIRPEDANEIKQITI